MTFATWWRGDPLPDLLPLPAFYVHPATDPLLIASVASQDPQTLVTRFQRGDRCYLAFMNDVPVAYGWVATQKGGVANLRWSFALPSGNCYLYNFHTLLPWRGRGIYPHLLQTIIRQEQAFDRFWIGYLPENEASGRGISKAGFQVVSDLVVTQGSVSGLMLFETHERALISADVFQLPIIAAS